LQTSTGLADNYFGSARAHFLKAKALFFDYFCARKHQIFSTIR
jgi:hypothetical protein